MQHDDPDARLAFIREHYEDSELRHFGLWPEAGEPLIVEAAQKAVTNLVNEFNLNVYNLYLPEMLWYLKRRVKIELLRRNWMRDLFKKTEEIAELAESIRDSLDYDRPAEEILLPPLDEAVSDLRAAYGRIKDWTPDEMDLRDETKVRDL
jgi:hypothetical protein